MNNTIKITALAPALLGMTACATTPADGSPARPDPTAQCDASDAQGMLGQRATAATGAELLRVTGASELRWVPPRTAVTMDFRAYRLTVSYDDNMIIERIACG